MITLNALTLQDLLGYQEELLEKQRDSLALALEFKDDPKLYHKHFERSEAFQHQLDLLDILINDVKGD